MYVLAVETASTKQIPCQSMIIFNWIKRLIFIEDIAHSF